MSKRYPGGVITANAITPNTDTASGLWTIQQHERAVDGNIWPSDPSDTYFNHTACLISGTAINGSNNNTFTDSSSNNFTLTKNGNVTPSSANPFGTSWSTYFNGASQLAITSNSSFNLGTSNFTLEFWIYWTTQQSTAPMFVIGTSGALWIGVVSNLFVIRAYGVSNLVTTSTLPSTGVWTHIAITRSGNNFTIYYNGSSVATGTSSQSFPQAAGYIGSDGAGTYFQGNISNLRLNSTVVYTGNFTPSTTPLTSIGGTTLLMCNSNNFRDTSGQNYYGTATGYVGVQHRSPFFANSKYSLSEGNSMYFDGTGDYLSVPSNSAWAIGTTGTVECWVYPTTWSANLRLWSVTNNSTNLDAYIDLNGKLGIHGGAILTGNSVLTYCWTHIAIVYNSGTITIYFNGVAQSVSGTTTGYNISSTGTLLIGSLSGSYLWSGYISGLRIVKGTAVYTGAFTPSTTPLTAITNTQLLLNSSPGIYDESQELGIDTVNLVQNTTAIAKYGSGCLAFGGGTTYLKMPYDNFFVGDATVECWVYFPASLQYQGIFGGGVDLYGINLQWQESLNGSLNLFIGNNSWAGGGYGYVTTQTLTAGNWYHLAYVKTSAGLHYLYINGVVDSSVNGVSASHSWSGTSFYIGVPQILTRGMSGYIDDFRITRSQRYSGNFTPPTAAPKR